MKPSHHLKGSDDAFSPGKGKGISMDNITFCQYFIGVHAVLPCLTDDGQGGSVFFRR
jgi:hypothetical protein